MIERLSKRKSRQGASKVSTLLDQIFELAFSKPLLSDAAVTAILEHSERLIAQSDIVWELFPTDNLERLDSILTLGLTPLTKESRENCVKIIATCSKGLSISAVVIDHLAGQHGLHGRQADPEPERLVSLLAIEQAEQALLTRIRRSSSNGELLSAASAMHVLWIWKRQTGPEEVREWLSRIIAADDDLLKLADLLPSTSYETGSYGRKETKRFRPEMYKDVLDIDQLISRLNDVAASNQHEGAQEVRLNFLRAIEAGRNIRQ